MKKCEYRKLAQDQDGIPFFKCNHNDCRDKDKICFSRLEVKFMLVKNNPTDCPLKEKEEKG